MRKISKIVGRVPIAQVSEVIGTRSPLKRKRFSGGVERYCRYGVRKQDGYLTEMQKLEFYDEDKLTTKEDRGIQFRNTTYNAALARFLHHCEKRFYKRMVNEDGTPMVMKGRSPIERGLIMAAQAKRFHKPKFVLMDHARFDAHINKWLLSEEHKGYLREHGYDEELKFLLKQQEGTMGFSHGGIVYRTCAKRSSGDINTGGGNSRINLGAILSWLASIGCRKFAIGCDGDDSYVIVEDEQELGDIAGHMLKLGLVTEVEVVHDLEEAEFCQSKVVWGKLGPQMVRNPKKVLDVLTKSPRIVTKEQARGILAASALGELMQAPGVPVISVAASCLITIAGGKPSFHTPDQHERFMVYRTDRIIPEVDDTMRVGFEKAWGITIAEQLATEQYYLDMADQTTEMPEIPEPKSKRSIESYEIWDDAPFYQPSHLEEDAWWLAEYPLGELVGKH
nr:MAG: RNA-dependent RNA polymerase [Riboviria sp.]